MCVCERVLQLCGAGLVIVEWPIICIIRVCEYIKKLVQFREDADNEDFSLFFVINNFFN